MEIAILAMPAVNALDQIAGAAFGPTSEARGDASGGAFAGLIQQALGKVNAAQGQADSAARQWQLGQNDVSLEDAMLSMQKANIAFQTTVQVRNKLVTAYNDIMNMQL